MTEADKQTLHLIIFLGFCLWVCLAAYWAYLNPLPHVCHHGNARCTAEDECEECWLDNRY